MRNLRSMCAILTALFLAILLAGCGGGTKITDLSSGFGRIVGTVYDQPAADRTRSPGTMITVSVDGTDLSTEAGADGRFVLDNVPAGLYTLVAVTPEGRAIAIVVAVEPGSETNVGEVVLREAGQIAGLVTSAVTHEPIAEAQVTITEMVYTTDGQMPHPVRTAYTDAAGSYTVSGLPVADYLVTISKEGFVTESLWLTVNAGSTTPGDAALQPVPEGETGGVAGTVYLRSDDGELHPLAGVLMRLCKPQDPILMYPLPATAVNESGTTVDLTNYGDGAPPPPFPEPVIEYYAYTDENGHYEITGVPAGDYVIAAIRPGMEPAEQPVTITANSVARVDFTLTLVRPRLGTIVGTVTNAETKAPIQGADVYAVYYAPMPMAGGIGPMGGGAVIFPDPDQCIMYTQTDEQGHYKLLVPVAVTAIAVYKDGFVPKEVPVSVVEDGTITVDVELSPYKTVKLSGHVSVVGEGDGGSLVPVSGATVTAVPVDTPLMVVYSAETDGEGYYEISLPAFTYAVYASKDNLYAESVTLTLTEDTTQDFVLSQETPPPTLLGGRRR
jgi:hypothetical protein